MFNYIGKNSINKFVFSLFLLVCMVLIRTSIYASTENDWFETYDINDTEKVWEMLMRPIIVFDVPEKKEVYLLDAPNGKRVKRDKMGGYIWGSQAGVKVLGKDEDGYTLIEGYDDYDRLLQGYVKTKLLKEVSPDTEFGIVIDKLNQTLYLFRNGKYVTKLSVSTGLVNKDQPYNETSSGEYLLSSWVGDFWSGNMLCQKAIRYNGGDLIHFVPALISKDGTVFDYSPFVPKLGTKASHGCVRVQEAKNEDGYSMQWLWNNLKKGTKVIVWDDTGRELPYTDDYTILYYNPNRGSNYHALARCSSVKEKYLPLTPFYYGQLRDTDPYKKLKPCPYCNPPIKEEFVDKRNRELLNDEKYEALMKCREESHKNFDPFNPPEHIVAAEHSNGVAPLGVKQAYPDDYTLVYYNPSGGKNYHNEAKCSNVRSKFWPLSPIYYGQLRSEEFNKLTPCPHCNPPMLEADIDKINKNNLNEEDYAKLLKDREEIHKHFDPKGVVAQEIEEEIQLDENNNILILPDSPQESQSYSNNKINEKETSLEDIP